MDSTKTAQSYRRLAFSWWWKRESFSASYNCANNKKAWNELKRDSRHQTMWMLNLSFYDGRVRSKSQFAFDISPKKKKERNGALSDHKFPAPFSSAKRQQRGISERFLSFHPFRLKSNNTKCETTCRWCCPFWAALLSFAPKLFSCVSSGPIVAQKKLFNHFSVGMLVEFFSLLFGNEVSGVCVEVWWLIDSSCFGMGRSESLLNFLFDSRRFSRGKVWWTFGMTKSQLRVAPRCPVH